LIFLFAVTPPPRLSPLSLHDALPISSCRPPAAFLTRRLLPPARPGPAGGHRRVGWRPRVPVGDRSPRRGVVRYSGTAPERGRTRSEEHTSELQSLAYLVCRLLLEKKK